MGEANAADPATGSVEQASGIQPGGGERVADPTIGQVIDGRYRILSKMATGGMATVYVARDQRLDRLVALKIMHRHLAESSEFVERFRREARSAARISHPGVVPIFDQGVFEGRGYLVMELVEGPDMRSYIYANTPLALGAALTFIEQILSALAAAHRSGVIHRDLKPENVLVGPDRNLRIVDFGLARAVAEGTLSSTGSIMGTVAYLAPEVALKGTLDARTDIYAVGIMAFELFTGSVPGDQSNPLMVAMSRVNEDIPPPSTIVEWLPTEIDDLVSALTSRDPAERPSSAAQALSLVEQTRATLGPELLAHPLPTPTPAKAVETLEKDPDRTDVLLAPAGTTVLPIEQRVVSTSGSIVTPEQLGTSTKSKRGWIITSLVMFAAIVGVASWWWWVQYGPGAYVQVPDLAGKTVEQAEDSLGELGLASYTTFENSDEVETDLIIKTDPAAGQKAHRNGEVNLVVSKGVLMITVPSVEGLEESDALKALEEKGLTVGEVEEAWSESVEAGVAISTDPAAETSVAHYDPVTLVVSKGPQPLTVPNLVGTAWTEAEATVLEMGLVPTATEAFSDEIGEGMVISQEPPGNEVLYRGDGISFVVSKGPEFIEVPSVYGMTTEDAVATLEAAGFQVEINKVANFFNSVGAQSPGSGELAARGSTVTITVV